jgi:DNA-binding response OmpR family regulator
MEQKQHILLCEDEESLGMLVREYLEAKGYEADLYLDGEAGYRAFMKRKYDMCLLDVMMPKMDGFSLAREIRLVNTEVPIIFLTAKNLKEDILEGFKIGADDYLTKPFSMDELVYRMEAILRRVKSKDLKNVTRFQLGQFIFDTQRQVLILGEEQTKLTTKESELLTLLCVHVNDVLERDLALKTIWMDDNYFNARSMDVYITKLRKLLKADPDIEINNVHGRGYRLVVPNLMPNPELGPEQEGENPES